MPSGSLQCLQSLRQQEPRADRKGGSFYYTGYEPGVAGVPDESTRGAAGWRSPAPRQAASAVVVRGGAREAAKEDGGPVSIR